MTFREKFKLCNGRYRKYQGSLKPYLCTKFGGTCSSKTCKLNKTNGKKLHKT